MRPHRNHAPPVLATTPRVVAEGYGWFLRRYDGRRVLDFLALIEILRRFADQALTSVSLVIREH